MGSYGDKLLEGEPDRIDLSVFGLTDFTTLQAIAARINLGDMFQINSFSTAFSARKLDT